jgi:hypothetical protein
VFELLIVLALVVCALLAAAIPWPSLFMAGVMTTAAGLVFGVATGFWYHVALARALAAVSALRPRWWLRPAAFHQRLDAASRPDVMRWFYAGAAGFVITVIGLALVALSVAVGLLRG